MILTPLLFKEGLGVVKATAKRFYLPLVKGAGGIPSVTLDPTLYCIQRTSYYNKTPVPGRVLGAWKEGLISEDL